MELQRASARSGPRLQIEEFDQGIELVINQRLVERRQRDGLRQAGAGLDEDEFGAQG